MTVSISKFFDSLGLPLNNRAWSWGSRDEARHIVLLRAWEDEYAAEDKAVTVLSANHAGQHVSLGWNERQRHLNLLKQGTWSGYAVMMTAKNPEEEIRKIQSYDDKHIFAIRWIETRPDGATVAILGDSVPISNLAQHAQQYLTAAGGTSLFEQHVKRFAQVEIRTQQGRFREAVFRACEGRCVVSNCDVPEALEAAHLRGRHWKQEHNSADDGILLRRDLHALYDNELLRINDQGRVELDARVLGHYPDMEGREVHAHAKRVAVNLLAPNSVAPRATPV